MSLAEETGVLVPPEDFLTLLAGHFARYEAQLVAFGFEPIRRAWLDRAARLGEVIVARTAKSETQGTFETIDLQGQLVLVTPRGRIAIPAADVYF